MSAAGPKKSPAAIQIPDGASSKRVPLTTAEYNARWDSMKNFRERLKSGPPPETYHLMTSGRITAEDYARYGWRAMRCADCQEHDLEMFWNHETVTWPPPKGVTLPGTAWGEDVTPICRCCSFAGCTHKQGRSAA